MEIKKTEDARCGAEGAARVMVSAGTVAKIAARYKTAALEHSIYTLDTCAGKDQFHHPR